MPNWCNNSITISGPTETIKQLWDDAQTAGSYVDEDGNTVEQFGLLNAMVPQPDFDSVTDLKEGMPNWWTWRVNTWGTKWDISDEGLEYVDNKDGTSHITGWFDSAWAPPIEAYNTFLGDMDNCSIEATYEEGGMDFAGIYDNGDDQYMEGLSEWCSSVVKGTCALEDTPELFQKLDDEFELIENRREWIEEEMEEEKAKEKVN